LVHWVFTQIPLTIWEDFSMSSPSLAESLTFKRTFKHTFKNLKAPKFLWVLPFLSLGWGWSPNAHGLGFGCAGVAGSVVFWDAIYGTGTGLLVAGVLEATRDHHDDWDKRVATGAAIGLGAGIVLGGLEVGLRDCSDPSRVKHTQRSPGGWRPRLTFMSKGQNSPRAPFGSWESLNVVPALSWNVALP
jgi:hypothetical protein